MKSFIRISNLKLLVIIGLMVSAATLSILHTTTANAANAPIKDTLCTGQGNVHTTNYKSPYADTSYMCLGKSQGTSTTYYQFAVELPSAIKDATVSGKNGKGQLISFDNTGNDKLFVSIPSSGTGVAYDAGMGYGATTPKVGCTTSDGYNNITITATGNGKTADPITFNLCSYPDETQAVIYNTALGLTGDDGTVASTGGITGTFGAARDDPVAAAEKYALYQQVGLVSISLTGPENHSDLTGTWYKKITDGVLTIPSLKPGTYSLSFVYNDRAVAINSSVGNIGSQASTAIKYSKTNIKVVANKLTNITPNGPEYRDTDGKIVQKVDTSDTSSTSTCAVDGVGWIICPVMNFMAKIVDGAYGIVSTLLTTPSLNTNTTDPSNGVYQTWSIMRNIANVCFVIVFLIIVFSQVTSIGVSNYGIKKLLPRIIISAILVNLSYLICAIGVDVSNILGSSIKQLMESIGGSITSPKFSNVGANGTGWEGIVGFLLAGTGAAAVILYSGLSILLPALIAALVAIVTVFLVLTLRQALIIILIILAPLAFVAFLLPNTENLFKKWRELLTTLLLMFPIIAFIFGGSALASKIIMASDTANFFVQVMGALVAIIPLFITPVVMKTAGGLLNRFGGFINNPNKGPFDRMQKGAERIRNDQQGRRTNRALNGGRVFGGIGLKRQARRRAISKGIESESKRAESRYISTQAQEVPEFANQLAGGRRIGPNASAEATQRAVAGAINVQAKLEADEVTAAMAIVQNARLDTGQMASLATTGRAYDTEGKIVLEAGAGSSLRKAAIQSAAQSDFASVSNLLDTAANGGFDAKELQTLVGALSSSSSKPTFVGQGALQRILQIKQEDGGDSTLSAANLAAEGIRANAYSPEKIASGDAKELDFVLKIAADDRVIGTADRERLGENAQSIESSPELRGKVQKNIKEVEALKGFKARATGPTSTGV